MIYITSCALRTDTIPPQYVLYASTKGAMQQYTRVLAKDLGRRGITVNAVAPGPVDTDFFRKDGKSEEFIRLIEDAHPAKRIPLPDEIAPTVAFLARDEAGWVNGQTIMVNGVCTHLNL